MTIRTKRQRNRVSVLSVVTVGRKTPPETIGITALSMTASTTQKAGPGAGRKSDLSVRINRQTI